MPALYIQGHLSMSGQWAPYNAEYYFNNDTDNYYIADPDNSMLNSMSQCPRRVHQAPR